MNLDDARRALNAGDDAVDVLRRVWHLLNGSDAHGMTGFKLPRVTNLLWRDPLATFQIERHGSLQGEIQKWRVDLRGGTAARVDERLQPSAAARAWDDVGKVAAELAGLIRAGEDDSRLCWRSDRRNKVMPRAAKALRWPGPAR